MKRSIIVGSLLSLVSLVGCGVRSVPLGVVPTPPPAPTLVVGAPTPTVSVAPTLPAPTPDTTAPTAQWVRCDDAAQAMCIAIVDGLPDGEVSDYGREVESCLDNHEPRAVVDRCMAMSEAQADVYATCMESALDLEEMNECEGRSARRGA